MACGVLFPFGCHGHNAIKLDHIHHRNRAVQGPLHCMAGSGQGSPRDGVHARGTDAHVTRLIYDVTTFDDSGTPTSTGEVLLWAGLSYPLPGAPATFLQAFVEAALATLLGVQTYVLQENFSTTRQSIAIHHQGVQYLVTNWFVLWHTSHALIWASGVVNAGQGCFVRSRSPHQQGQVFIR